MARPADTNARLDLLRAAEAVFVERGLDRAKVEDITARAGRSKGSFYLHFESKEEAFRQVVMSTLARLVDRLDDSRRAAERAHGIENLEAYFARWLELDLEVFEFVWQNRGVFRLLLEGGQSATFNYMVDTFAELARTSTAALLEYGMQHDAYRSDLDVDLTSRFISGAYDRVARDLVHRYRKPDLRAWLHSLQRLVLRGIASDPTLGVTDRPVNYSGNRSGGAGIEVVAPNREEKRDDRRRAGQKAGRSAARTGRG
jgi:AcrR family transcriptional regulator